MREPSFTVTDFTQLAELPNRPAVFLLQLKSGRPYLRRTGLLRGRLLRMARMLHLEASAERVDCWLTGSSLESSLVLYALAREQFPDSYRDITRLRLPSYVKILLDNPFPRSTVTTHLGRGAVYYGPFPSRAAAERFDSQMLDLFQLRRCPEDLTPASDHPGCMYGEMGMCLRPCQQIVGIDEYRGEAERVVHFLETDGRSLREPLAAARDRLSEEMEFEAAARQHRRLEKIDDVLRLRDDLAAHIDRLHGVAVTPSVTDGAVTLHFLHAGCWQTPQPFPVAATGGDAVSLDQRLRELVSGLDWTNEPARRRQEHLALLARWFWSSWRDGDWVRFSSVAEFPYKKLVRAISRVAGGR